MKDLYLLSGLGADKRVFDFLDLSGFVTHHIEWIDPARNEPITSYATRLLPQIQSLLPVLIGVSFGGAMAIEIGKLIPTAKIILISSIKTKYDLPWISRVLGRLGLHKVLPLAKVHQSRRITCHLFGAASRTDQELLMSILKDTDVRFLRWGLGQMMRLENAVPHEKATLIHGTNDLILPHQNGDIMIEGGGHFMIVNRATEISGEIRKLLTGF